jgi:hypothetical protein
MDATVREGGDQGKPIVLTHPESSASVGLEAIMDNMMVQLGSEHLTSAPNIEITD